jgi:hypothetical protein
MAIFGGGVRPELGRTDYGAVARGSEIAAQLSAQGSQMMAQGVASASQSLAKAMDQYEKNKVMASAQTGKFEAAVQSGMIKLDALPENIAKTANKLVKDGAVGLKDAVMLGAYADQFMQAENDKIAKDYRMLQTDLLRQQQKDSSALAGVVSKIDMFRDTDGNLDKSDIIQAYVEGGGTNLSPLAKTLESMEIEPETSQVVPEVPGLPVKSATETRIEAEAFEEKRILDIQRTAIALDGDERKKYLDNLPLTDRGAARKAIRAYEGRGETAGLLDQILNPAGTSAPTGGSNNKEFRSNF